MKIYYFNGAPYRTVETRVPEATPEEAAQVAETWPWAAVVAGDLYIGYAPLSTVTERVYDNMQPGTDVAAMLRESWRETVERYARRGWTAPDPTRGF
jgi:hypothetical protein